MLSVEQFLKQSENSLVLDVRTPVEYQRGHIPGAANLPLFSNEERSVIGTLYKHQGREVAVLKGLEYVGPRMKAIVENIKEMAAGKDILVHCWRGGMRSNSLAWLLKTSGLPVAVLNGGYKSFRQFVLNAFAQPYNIIVLSGATGSGKTAILKALETLGEQIIDLEGLANHKGSAFGFLGEDEQPTQQQFENKLALALNKLDPSHPVWVEDESRYIGSCIIPDDFWQQKILAPVLLLEMPAALRVQRLMADYAHCDQELMKLATTRLEKRLGGKNTQTALQLLSEGNLAAFTAFLLENYYDKAYRYGLQKRDSNPIVKIDTRTPDAAENAAAILQLYPQGFNIA